jgi:predicted PurR-regulated permease PerM
MKVTIDASSKTFVRFWLVPLGLLIAGMAIYSARTALIIIGTALFLALALNGPVSRLARHLPGKSRAIGTAISYIVVVALLGTFAFLAVPPIVQQTAKFVQTVPALVDTAQRESQGLRTIIDEYNLEPQVDRAVTSLEENSSRWASSVGANIISGIGSVFSLIAAIILVLVLSFLMLIEGPAMMRKLWSLYDDQDRMEHHRTVVHRMHAVVAGYVTGQLTVSSLGAFSAGLFVFILSFFFDIPANLAIPAAAVTFILSLIPMFGATIGGVLIAALLAFNDVGAAITYIVYFVVYQQIENNYISPTIQSKRLELSALTILASVTVGLYLFGIAGGIVSIPIAGCVKVLFDTWQERAHAKRQKSKRPVAKLAEKLRSES